MKTMQSVAAESYDDDDDEVPTAVPLVAELGRNVPSQQPAGEVPVTLITGFLGAGKTTLVNYILHERHGERIAVILNEFGEELGIERALVSEGQGALVEEWVELANGCICCTVKNDLLLTLESLMTKRDRFDYVLLETTGLADPGPIAQMLWVDKQLECPVYLDAIVTVIDGAGVLGELRKRGPDGAVNEAAVQIAFADVVLLNKVDLLAQAPAEPPHDAEQDHREGAQGPSGGPVESAGGVSVADVRDALRSINATADVIECHRCQIDLKRILRRRAFEPEEAAPVTDPREAGAHGDADGAVKRRPGPDRQALCEASDLRHRQGRRHLSDVSSCLLSLEGELDLEKVQSWLENLLWKFGGTSRHAAQNAPQQGAQVDPEAVPNQVPASGQGTRDKPVGDAEAWQDRVQERAQGRGAHEGRPGLCEGGNASVHGSMDRSIAGGKLATTSTADGGEMELFRVKGILSVTGSERKHMLQAVRELYEILPVAPPGETARGGGGDGTPPGCWAAGEVRRSRIVAIGRHLDQRMLQEGLERCAR
eukprot:jgi/Mesvir1/18084/Mv09385-RA.1